MSGGYSATSSKSVQSAKKKLQKFLKELDRLPTEELSKEVPRIYAEAVAQTPYSSGTLEASVYVRLSKNTKNRVGILAGATATSKGYNYAGIQHDNKKFHHPTKGKAMYIADPFNAGTKRLKKRLKLRVSRAKPK